MSVGALLILGVFLGIIRPLSQGGFLGAEPDKTLNIPMMAYMYIVFGKLVDCVTTVEIACLV